MGVKRLNPVTPGTRFRIANTFEELTTSKPEKKLLVSIKKSGGRNNQGKMTMRYIGGGHKKQYRLIDFKRSKTNVAAIVKSIEYDPNRTCFIALIEYTDGELSYILAPNGLKVGQTVISGSNATPDIGNTLALKNMPLGSIIHNIELNPGQGGKIVRSAGTSAQLTSRDGKYAVIKLPSGETRMILSSCCATIGTLSNGDHSLENKGKAGRSRWLGRRPRTRPAAMNPVDHPMGGGEGRAKGGQARTRKGTGLKGHKTRSPHKSSNKLILERRKK